MNYAQAMVYLNSLERARECSLEETRLLLEKLGNPQNNFQSIHVAGTNGKGSCCAYLASIFREAGYKVGMYTSPFLMDFEERMQIDRPVTQKALAKVFTQVREVAEANDMALPGYFGFTTAAAFLWFAQNKIDLAIVEVGLGGRNDPTNVLQPTCCLLTSISKDHTKLLGNTVEAITREKCGIIKNGVMVVSQKQTGEAASVIDATCKERNAGLISLANASIKAMPTSKGERFTLAFGGHTWKDLEIPLMGLHQIQNAAAAVLTVNVMNRAGFTVTPEQIQNGLKKTKWPGRMEPLRMDGTTVILDGAHNPDAAKKLKNTVERHYGKKNIVLLCGIMKDKDARGITKNLEDFAKEAVCTQVPGERALDAKKLATYFKKIPACAVQNVQQALETACKQAKAEDGIVVAAGSIYLCGAVREIIKAKRSKKQGNGKESKAMAK